MRGWWHLHRGEETACGWLSFLQGSDNSPSAHMGVSCFSFPYFRLSIVSTRISRFGVQQLTEYCVTEECRAEGKHGLMWLLMCLFCGRFLEEL